MRKLIKAVRNPQIALKYIKRQIHGRIRIRLQSINQRYHARTYNNNNNGYDLINADWDTAIILDACRYDTFADCNRYDGDLVKKTAVGSESREFFKSTFKGKDFHDTVYVTGNPYITILDDDTFHNTYVDQAWNIAGTAAAPDRMTDVAIKAHKSHPNKRIIVHYMQPHLPIVAPGYDDINDDIRYYGGDYFPCGDLTVESLYDAYEANLRYVLDHVDDLLADIQGKVLITSDHGELMGERQSPIPIKGFDHQEQLYVDGLMNVPWITVDNGSRRYITSDDPVGKIDIDEQDRRDQLRSLGYL